MRIVHQRADEAPAGGSLQHVDFMPVQMLQCDRTCGYNNIALLSAQATATSGAQVLELGEGLADVSETETEQPLKCSTFSASGARAAYPEFGMPGAAH